MKDITLRSVIIVAFIAIAVYFLLPTFKDYKNTDRLNADVAKKRIELKKAFPGLDEDAITKKITPYEDSIKANDADFREARAKRIKLGLDLQGGMRLVMEVNMAKLLEKLPEKPDDTYRQIVDEASKEAARSNEPIVDIVIRKLKERNIRINRYFGSVREDEDKTIANLKKQTEDAVTRAVEIIRNRVDQYGVSEPSIQRQGERRIVVELPGIAREEEAKQLLQGTALLEFKLLKDPEIAINVMKKINEVLAGKKLDDSTAAVDSAKKAENTADKSKPNEKKQLTQEEFAKQYPFWALAMPDPSGRSADLFVAAGNKDKVMRLLSREDVRQVIPNNMQFSFSAKPIGFSKDGQATYGLYCLNKTAEINGNVVTNAIATVDQQSSGAVVNMEMSGDGAADWARITGANIGKRCAIVLDDAVFSSPVIRNKISGGGSRIEGMANMEEAKLLEIVLKAGALPAPVDVIEQRTIGPSLGADSVAKGMDSMIFGYILVAVFMMLYYQRSGSIAALGLAMTVLFIFGLLAAFKATLTLPGIAGIVLTMGVAVDANVLIYERIREEYATGKTMRAAVDSGYERAFSAILDSNVTTLITSVILYNFGTGPVQGFALTLMIGIITSLFSTLVICRVIMDFMLNKNYAIKVG
ncbi:MAG: protein translocase subunit SecD [Ignavibacteria bacterium]|nr:protein translocase subunit SecD [Ignavibacteria bacterium]